MIEDLIFRLKNEIIDELNVGDYTRRYGCGSSPFRERFGPSHLEGFHKIL
jgi:hypothetical protein